MQEIELELGKSIMLGDIRLQFVSRVGNKRARLGIAAPRNIPVERMEKLITGKEFKPCWYSPGEKANGF